MKLVLLCAFVALSNLTMAQFKLEIELNNLSSNEGEITLKLFDETQNQILIQTGTIENKKCTIIIDNLKSAKYAISYYHDENSNGKLDKNFMGMPTEGYGFSNNAYSNFGPEPFENMLFEIKGNTKIELITKN